MVEITTKNFFKKLISAFFVWGIISLEIVWILVFVDNWLDLTWITIGPTANSFFDGIIWLFGFVIWTALTTLIVTAFIVDLEDEN